MNGKNLPIIYMESELKLNIPFYSVNNESSKFRLEIRSSSSKHHVKQANQTGPPSIQRILCRYC